jgi:hypothetical protein
MRDPYEILGVTRGASFAEVKAAYRRACKTKHPDVGGSTEEMQELNTAYAFILEELKSGYQQKREEAPKSERAQQGEDEQGRRRWEKAYRDIDDELEALRRAARDHEEALRTMRAKAWQSGERVVWAKLTWDDLARFLRGVARSGVKGLALLFAALIGLGSVLVEANVVSAFVILGSAIGLLFSLGLKSDRGGIVSAGLLLFGIMTIWLPPVRAALFGYPLATVSVLICLALILKFVQVGGAVGAMTGGVLALYVIGVILTTSQQRGRQAGSGPAPPLDTFTPTPQVPGSGPTATISPRPRPSTTPTVVALPPPPEPRTLLAAKGAVLKFVSGIPYRLKVRTGFTTWIDATEGTVAFYVGDSKIGDCMAALEFPMHASSSPYEEVDQTIRACGADATLRVTDVR